jgi:hypothetical protein
MFHEFEMVCPELIYDFYVTCGKNVPCPEVGREEKFS